MCEAVQLTIPEIEEACLLDANYSEIEQMQTIAYQRLLPTLPLLRVAPFAAILRSDNVGFFLTWSMLGRKSHLMAFHVKTARGNIRKYYMSPLSLKMER